MTTIENTQYSILSYYMREKANPLLEINEELSVIFGPIMDSGNQEMQFEKVKLLYCLPSHQIGLSSIFKNCQNEDK